MMKWEKITINTLNEGPKEAQAPVIISASRSTDMPAFYTDWLVKRIEEGYVKWINPFNGVPLYISFNKTRLIVFWSKNPAPMFKHLEFFNEKIKNFYFQFTLNDYDNEKYEPRVPCVQKRIETFIKLSEIIGKERVIWRFDPLMITDKTPLDTLLQRVEKIGNALKDYTKKFVFSFADIRIYRKVQINLKKSDINYCEFNERTMYEFAMGIEQLNKNWGFEIGTCAESISLEKYGIVHNKCIDDDLIIKLFHKDKILMDFMGVQVKEPDMFNPDGVVTKLFDNKDKGQREFCGCIMSKDIGEYNTCPHLCEYCYANASKEVALENYKKHLKNRNNEFIKG